MINGGGAREGSACNWWLGHEPWRHHFLTCIIVYIYFDARTCCHVTHAVIDYCDMTVAKFVLAIEFILFCCKARSALTWIHRVPGINSLTDNHKLRLVTKLRWIPMFAWRAAHHKHGRLMSDSLFRRPVGWWRMDCVKTDWIWKGFCQWLDSSMLTVNIPRPVARILQISILSFCTTLCLFNT